LILGYLADGRRSFEPRRVQPLLLVGIGLALAVAVAITPLLFGDALLESAIVKLHVPVVGEVKLVSSALFDVGVMVLVTGVVLAALAAFVRAIVDPSPEGVSQ
jgi:multisubunit Na+/H+ antiporter MnhB subunit